ncbi:MAG TPA: hypothetical protein PK970_09015 [Hyphomicrobiaceae bacterium]|nr:hypothetical protein [Hyphomicrobiaceae bacterium]
MKGIDAILLGSVLLLVPSFAWLFGRFAGRRNWSVTAALAGAVAIGAGLYALAAAAQSVLSPASAAVLGWPEIPGFLIVFAGFVTLIGWAGTPVAGRRSDSQKS